MSTNTDHFGEASKASLTSINSVVLLACGTVGASLSLYADLFRGLLPDAAGYAALLGWVSAVLLTLYLAGRNAGGTGTVGRLSVGLRLARKNLGFALLILAMTAAAAFTAWSRVKSEQGGVLNSLVTIARDTQAQATQAAAAAKSADQKAGQIIDDTKVIRAVVTRELPPIEALAKLGYTTSDADACRAAVAGNEEALALLSRAGVKSPSYAQQVSANAPGLCLEPILLRTSREVNLGMVFSHLPPQVKELNALYFSQYIVKGGKEIEDLSGLLGSFGIVKSDKVRLLEIHATPLMFAIWGNNLEAVETLLALNTNPDLGGDIGVMDMTTKPIFSLYSIKFSPLAEAKRLRRTSIQTALQKRGAKVVAVKGAMSG